MKLLLGKELNLDRLIKPKKLVVKFHKNFFIFEVVINKPVKIFLKEVKIGKNLSGKVITIVDEHIIKKIYAKGFIEVKEKSGAVKVFGDYVDVIQHSPKKIDKIGSLSHEALYYIVPEFSNRGKSEFLKLRMYKDRYFSESYIIGNMPHSSIEFKEGINNLSMGGEEVSIAVEELSSFNKQITRLVDIELYSYKSETGSKMFFIDNSVDEVLYETNSITI